MAQVSDDHLARQATQGDSRAFEAIFQRYHRDLYRFCLAMVGNPHDAQDALQNTMVKVLRALPGEERQINLKPWLYRIAHNEAVETVRRRRDSVELDPDQGTTTVGLAETAEHRERLRGLIADLDELPERQRAALVMRELAGLGFEQIGAAFETSPAVARQTVYEARLSLRQMEEGREMSCDLVMRELSDADGRVTRRREVRAHLRGCASCRAFRDSIGARRGEFAAIAPLPAALSAGMLHSILSGKASAAGLSGSVAGASGGAGGAGMGTGGVAGTIGAGAGKAVATSALLKAAATVAVVATVGATAADRSGLIDVPLVGGGAKSSQASSAAPGSDAPGRGAAAASEGAGGRNGAAGGGMPGAGSTQAKSAGGTQRGGSGPAVRGAGKRHAGSSHMGSSNAEAKGHGASHGRRAHGGEGMPAASGHGQSTAAPHRAATHHATRHAPARHGSQHHSSRHRKSHRRRPPPHSSHQVEPKPAPPKPAPSKEGGAATAPTTPPATSEPAGEGAAGGSLTGVE